MALAWPPAAAAEAPAAADHYALEARLDAEAHRIEGSLQLTVQVGTAPLSALHFHLYPNAFEGPQSVFSADGKPLPPRQQGGISLQSLAVDGRDLLHAAEHEVLPGDHTQLVVPLPQPAAAGSSLLVEIRFNTQLPRLSTRSGYVDDFHFAGQWYPKLAHRTPGGDWTRFPYHRRGEFYANFATYELTVNAPGSYRLEAAGARHPVASADRTIVRFRHGPAHDIAWVACQECSLKTEKHGELELRSMTADGLSVGRDRQLEVVRRGLDHFGEMLGPYPYGQLVVVLPPRDARAASAMEYPGLFTTRVGATGMRVAPLLDGRHVTAHELAHQWFHTLLANDEVRWPVLDEGLAEWAAADLMRQIAESPAPFGWPTDLDTFDLLRLHAFRGPAPALPSDLPAYAYPPTHYGRALYTRPAVALESIRRAHGRARFERVLRGYVTGSRLAHPTPNDLKRAFDTHYGNGFFERVVRPLVLEGATSELHLAQVEQRSSDGGFTTRVTAHRSGRGHLPTWLALYDRAGDEIARAAWPAESPTLKLDAHTQRPVARVRADPDQSHLCDPNWLDHDRSLEPQTGVSWSARWMLLWQAFWSWVGP